jgi:hypothetical protein
LLIVTTALLSVISACSFGKATTYLSNRTPSGTPDHFVVGTSNGSATSEPTSGEGCRNPMVDPRGGTRLQLIRSAEGQVDYEVPPGRYGVSEDELLRLECGTGRVVEIVKR